MYSVAYFQILPALKVLFCVRSCVHKMYPLRLTGVINETVKLNLLIIVVFKFGC
jgi:hypothetical protein